MFGFSSRGWGCQRGPCKKLCETSPVGSSMAVPLAKAVPVSASANKPF